jgi:hypothetical protein
MLRLHNNGNRYLITITTQRTAIWNLNTMKSSNSISNGSGRRTLLVLKIGVLYFARRLKDKSSCLFQKTFKIIRNTCNVSTGAGLKHYHTFLCFKTCFTNVFTTFDSIQLRSGWVLKLPNASTQLDEDRNDLTDKIWEFKGPHIQ